MRTLIVDDEPLARARLKRLLAEHPAFEWVGEAADAAEALQKVIQLVPDLVMLDIEMPGGDGLSLAETLNQRQIPPAIILVTAHPEHALDAYRVGPSDYLLKPVDPKRLKAALERLGTHTRAHLEKNDELNPWISYQIGNSIRRIRFEKVQYFMAEDKVVKMVFDGGEAIMESSLKQLEAQYTDLVLRIHRNTLVNANRLNVLIQDPHKGSHILISQSEVALQVSRRHATKVRAWLETRRPVSP